MQLLGNGNAVHILQFSFRFCFCFYRLGSHKAKANVTMSTHLNLSASKAGIPRASCGLSHYQNLCFLLAICSTNPNVLGRI